MCYTVLRQFEDFSVKLLGFVISVIAHFGFEDRSLCLVVPHLGHCLYYSLFLSSTSTWCKYSYVKKIFSVALYESTEGCE